MSILIGRDTRLVVQGITGREGEFHSRAMLPDDLDGGDHVERRDAFGDAEDGRDAGRGRFHDRIGGAGCRHEDERGVGPGLANRLGDGVEDGNRVIQRALAALARGDARDDVRAVVP